MLNCIFSVINTSWHLPGYLAGRHARYRENKTISQKKKISSKKKKEAKTVGVDLTHMASNLYYPTTTSKARGILPHLL